MVGSKQAKGAEHGPISVMSEGDDEMKTAIFAAALATGAMAGAAFAGSFDAQPVPASDYDWAGAYVGVQSGWIDSNVHSVWSDTWYADPDAESGVTGLYAGINRQGRGRMVYGIEAEYNWADADGRADEMLDGAPSGDDYVYGANIKETAAIRARLGYALGRTLVYGAAGLAYADYDFNLSRYGSNYDGASEHAWGWTAGFGVERAFGERWVGRIDYRYTEFRTDEPLYYIKNDMDISELRLGLAMRF